MSDCTQRAAAIMLPGQVIINSSAQASPRAKRSTVDSAQVNNKNVRYRNTKKLHRDTGDLLSITVGEFARLQDTCRRLSYLGRVESEIQLLPFVRSLCEKYGLDPEVYSLNTYFGRFFEIDGPDDGFPVGELV